MEFAESLEQLWVRYQIVVDDFRSANAEVATLEREACPAEYGLAFGSFGDRERDKLLEETAGNLRDRLVAEAVQQFSPPRAEVQIDTGALRERFPVDTIDAARAFRPKVVWEYLAETYGGQAGAHSAYAKTARTIIQTLRICRNDSVKRTAGRVVLDHSVWIDAIWDEPRLSYGSSEMFGELRAALAAFMLWADHPEAASALTHGYSWNYHSPVTSREKFHFGEVLTLITYKSRFEYRFAPDVAAQLQVFLSTYGDQYLDRKGY